MSRMMAGVSEAFPVVGCVLMRDPVFLLKRFDQVVWTLFLESVFGGSFKLGM